MKFFLALVGTLCLGTVIKAQSTVSINVAGNVTLGLTGLNNTIAAINNTINKADTAIWGAWTNWANVLITNLTSIMNRFEGYPTSVSSQLSSLNYSIENLQNMLNTQPYYLLSNSELIVLYSNIYQLAEQTGDLLNTVAQNMSTEAICTNDYSVPCLRKYGLQLTTAPVLMSRFNNCLLAENARINNIGINMTTQINSSLAIAQTFINLLSVCTVPTAVALNQTWPQFVPAADCLSMYLAQLGSQMQMNSPSYVVDMMQYSQVQMVVFRANRCAKLAQYDIQNSVVRTQAAFTKCLTTGS
ncbi:uncharacterized protein LOC128737969 [Sabethes cyaneus]|uniref:uncharacterized protein LOC128737969 n=1 Tax=Sabethes cyaneus TaxID=53552 RepID=UPI00237E7357|nr:uncharacterized protein LOC128737969 [Sabethes cyaneus]